MEKAGFTKLIPIGAACTLSDLKAWVEEANPDVIVIPVGHTLRAIHEFNPGHTDTWTSFRTIPIEYEDEDEDITKTDNDLDISMIPKNLVSLGWLRHLIGVFDNLIIAEDQLPIFRSGGRPCDLYRDHMILIHTEKGLKTVAQYTGRSTFAGSMHYDVIS